MLLRVLASQLSPAGSRARLSILIYHRVLAQPDALLSAEPDAAAFRWQLQVLSSLFTVLPLSEAVERLAKGTLPARAACITFDDGYADNATVALPILKELGLPATFFIATGYLDGGLMFNDRILETLRRVPEGAIEWPDLGLDHRLIGGDQDRKQIAAELIQGLKHLEPSERQARAQAIAERSPTPLPKDLMMTREQVKHLAAAGMTIGGHTHAHPILARTPDAQARAEIAGGRETLEHLLGEPVHLFAYPNGKPEQDYDHRHVTMVREAGFAASVSTAWGVSTSSSDPYQLARFTPWDQTPGRFALRLVRNLLTSRGAHEV
ncbi:polysaccharide deacetylase family protein [Halochromatium salexigens]|uniref:Polysaccharide deacetylase n=1 Tax=Halochromatium salexigens TaxID=49447 RepID=A0AAJ0UHC6_HALSE|nr:polysaccharide deacetylase family protein [Halochromatium salexigens]MBK5930562.1 polysaccharide deacetylase [Halochromatium salexigens]